MGKNSFDIDKINIPEFLLDRRFLMILLFVLAIAVRLMFKNAGLFHWDSLKDVMMVERMLEQGGLQYSYAYGAPGMVVLVFIFYYIHHLLTGILSAESAYFFVTFLTAALSVVMVYLITEKYTKDRFISFGAALLFNFTPIFLSVTTYPKTHSIGLFFALLSMYIMILYNERGKEWLLALSGFIFGYAVTIRLLAAAFILPIAYIYLDARIKNSSLKLDRNKLSLRNLALFAAPMAVIWLVLLWGRIMQKGGFIGYLNDLFAEQGSAVGWQGFFSSSLLVSLSQLYTTMTILGVVMFAAGLYYGFKRYKWFTVLILLWGVPSFFYFTNVAVPNPRFFVPFLPVIMIFIALGCGLVYRRNKLAAIVILLLIAGLMFYNIYPVIKFRHEHSATKETALWIRSVTEPDAVIMSNDFGFFIRYYGNRETIMHPRSGDVNEINDFLISINEYLKEGTPVYSTGEGFALDPGKRVLEGITTNFEVVPVGEHENEIYQASTLELRKYKEPLFRIEAKQTGPEQAGVNETE